MHEVLNVGEGLIGGGHPLFEASTEHLLIKIVELSSARGPTRVRASHDCGLLSLREENIVVGPVAVGPGRLWPLVIILGLVQVSCLRLPVERLDVLDEPGHVFDLLAIDHVALKHICAERPAKLH